MNPQEIDQLLRPVLLKDLRVILRARGINPAGGKEHLELLLKQHMLASGDFSLRAEADYTAYSALGSASEKQLASDRTNNYARPGGSQNIGNHLTDRNSSRVLAPPGGVSQISFGDYGQAPAAPPPQQQQYQQGPPQGYQGGPPPDYQQGYQQGAPPPQYPSGGYQGGGDGGNYGGGAPPASQYQGPGQPGGSPNPGGLANNNYSRPNGMQNVGNFLTDRPSSRVLAPPGGKSQISFG